MKDGVEGSDDSEDGRQDKVERIEMDAKRYCIANLINSCMDGMKNAREAMPKRKKVRRMLVGIGEAVM